MFNTELFEKATEAPEKPEKIDVKEAKGFQKQL